MPNIARYSLHFWEEPCISGFNGSGAIFFCGCNLDCIFCQNNKINHALKGEKTDPVRMAEIMLELQAQGAHNINLVSPTPFTDVIAESIVIAKDGGLVIPVVYNTNSYEKVNNLRILNGLIDIYLPDLKYVTSGISMKYSKAADYFKYAAPAIGEMFSQCGLIKKDKNGLATKGTIIRHLVLPGSIDETRRVIDYIADNFPPEIDFSLMGQYTPFGIDLPKPLDRKLMKSEYDRAIEYAIARGLKNVLIQNLSSATDEFTPEF